MKLKSLINFLPRGLRQRQLRRHFLSSASLPDNITIKLARNLEEREASLALSEVGRDPRLPYSRKWGLLPCSVNVICCDGDEILATATLTLDSGFGLPSDEFHNLGRLRQQGLSVAEVTGLVLKSETLFLPIFRYLTDYARKVFRADALILTSRKEFLDLYAGALLFEELKEGRILGLGHKRDENLVTQILDFHGMESRFINAEKLHRFFFEEKFKNFQMETPRFAIALDAPLPEDQFHHFFLGQHRVLDELSSQDRLLLADLYRSPILRNILLQDQRPAYRRSSPRIPARFSVSVFNDNRKFRTGEIRQIAREGLALRMKGFDYAVGETISIVLDTGDSERIHVSGKIVWAGIDAAGVRLAEVPEAWHELNDFALYPEERSEVSLRAA